MWELDYKESWVLKNWCFWTVVLDKTLESPLDSKEIQPVHPEGDQSWIFIGRIDIKLKLQLLWPPECKELTHWKRPWCCERLKAGGERDDRGWDAWMTSLTQWRWVSVNTRGWWWTGKPGMLQSMLLQRVGQDWATELNFAFYIIHSLTLISLLKSPIGMNSLPVESRFTNFQIFKEILRL